MCKTINEVGYLSCRCHGLDSIAIGDTLCNLKPMQLVTHVGYNRHISGCAKIFLCHIFLEFKAKDTFKVINSVLACLCLALLSLSVQNFARLSQAYLLNVSVCVCVCLKQGVILVNNSCERSILSKRLLLEVLQIICPNTT